MQDTAREFKQNNGGDIHDYHGNFFVSTEAMKTSNSFGMDQSDLLFGQEMAFVVLEALGRGNLKQDWPVSELMVRFCLQFINKI